MRGSKILLAIALIFVSTSALDSRPRNGPWEVAYSPGVPKRLKNNAIRLPTVSNPAYCAHRKHACPSVHYIWRRTNKKPRKTVSVVFDVRTTGNPVFNYKLEPSNTCNRPAAVSLILQKRGDNMRAANGRFWAKPEAVLRPGVQVYNVRIARHNFINVWGQKPSKRAWHNMMRNMGRIGLTLGGGCFKGHGVNVSGGTANFKLKKFRW